MLENIIAKFFYEISWKLSENFEKTSEKFWIRIILE